MQTKDAGERTIYSRENVLQEFFYENVLFYGRLEASHDLGTSTSLLPRGTSVFNPTSSYCWQTHTSHFCRFRPVESKCTRPQPTSITSNSRISPSSVTFLEVVLDTLYLVSIVSIQYPKPREVHRARYPIYTHQLSSFRSNTGGDAINSSKLIDRYISNPLHLPHSVHPNLCPYASEVLLGKDIFGRCGILRLS